MGQKRRFVRHIRVRWVRYFASRVEIIIGSTCGIRLKFCQKEWIGRHSEDRGGMIPDHSAAIEGIV